MDCTTYSPIYMKQFLNEDFLLSTETAKTLYHDHAEHMPIVDYHCHINPEEIAKDKTFEDMSEVWLGGDHYKWRLMRANGIEEAYITGNASGKEKFKAFAKTLQIAIGNPIYHWSHLELKRYFGYDGVLNESTADYVWDLCNEKLKDASMSARGIIKFSNVKVICTTDDPIDDLRWHKQMKKDTSFDTAVYPAFRPDKAMNIEKPEYIEYLQKLSDCAALTINTFDDLIQAIENRIKYFDSCGCRISDHGLEYVMFHPASHDDVEQIFKKRLLGEILSEEEVLIFKTAFMIQVGRLYHKYHWIMQLHYGTKRDNNTSMFRKIGPDTGFDCIHKHTPSDTLANFLDALCITDQLPKTIVYSLNPSDNAAIQTVIGCFQDSSAIGKIQQGAAWWFNDHKTGMVDQITACANSGLLANFNGMLTDSRSFLSYTRHEYFRRILCDVIGTWVEHGEFPADEALLGKIVEDISFYNAMRYFQF